MIKEMSFGRRIFEVTFCFGLIALIPTLIFIGFFTTIESQRLYSSSSHDAGIVATTCWLTLLTIFGLFTWRYIYKRRRLAKLLSVLKNNDVYDPHPANEMREVNCGAYFGVDTQRGTLLYIRLCKNNEVDILGFNLSNWRKCTLEHGQTLRLYIHSVDTPYIEIQHRRRARMLFEKISAMREQHYDYVTNYPEMVKNKARRLGGEMGFTTEINMA